jgi:hypothetical protein
MMGMSATYVCVCVCMYVDYESAYLHDLCACVCVCVCVYVSTYLFRDGLHKANVNPLQAMRRQEIQTHIHPRVAFLSQGVHPVCVCLCLEVAEVLVVDVVHDGVDAAVDFEVVAVAGGVLFFLCVCVCVNV